MLFITMGNVAKNIVLHCIYLPLSGPYDIIQALSTNYIQIQMDVLVDGVLMFYDRGGQGRSQVESLNVDGIRMSSYNSL